MKIWALPLFFSGSTNGFPELIWEFFLNTIRTLG